MGLRLRLNLLLSLLFSLALAVAIVYLLGNTRRAVVDELRASTELASHLLRGFRDSGAAAGDASAVAAFVAHLAQQHAPLRHLRILLADAPPPAADADPGQARQAPAWFARLVAPHETVLRQAVVLGGTEVSIVADASAEIGEAWREVRTTLLVLLLAFAGSNVVAFVFLGHALAPLRRLSAALEGVGRGRYATRLATSGIPDIDVIVSRFNEMTAALERSESDNANLARRSLAIQEHERRHLAHELHDEMGQSITAIKALAVSIGERVEGPLAERARTIVDVSSDVYARVRQMMTRLHPVILDELGLAAAVELMVDDWNGYHRGLLLRTGVLPRAATTRRRSAHRCLPHRAGGTDEYRPPRSCQQCARGVVGVRARRPGARPARARQRQRRRFRTGYAQQRTRPARYARARAVTRRALGAYE